MSNKGTFTGITISDIKLYYRTTVRKTGWYGTKTKGWKNRTESKTLILIHTLIKKNQIIVSQKKSNSCSKGLKRNKEDMIIFSFKV